MQSASNQNAHQPEQSIASNSEKYKIQKIKDKFWNSKKKNIQFDEEKPSAASTNIDEDEIIKYIDSSRKSRQNNNKKSRLNKKTLETFSASQHNSNEEKNENDMVSIPVS